MPVPCDLKVEAFTMNIVETSIKKPLINGVIYHAAGTLGGLLSYKQAQSEPDCQSLRCPCLLSRLVYPGAGASEVETTVTKRIEDALSTLENLKKITSTSMEGVSVIAIDLEFRKPMPTSPFRKHSAKYRPLKSDLPI
jgi:HAE1 family hydrophobic/amphiphilic exporter-1